MVEIRIQNGYELDELHDVSAQNPTNGDILQYVAATDLWTKNAGTTTNIAEGTNLYYTDARSRAAFSESVTGLDYNSTTGVLSTTSGFGIPTTASQSTWNTAYNRSLTSAAVTGTTTKTLTLNQQDGGSISASWTDINTDAMFSSASSFNQPLNNWDVSKVTEMRNMFTSASSFNQDIGNWNVSSSMNMLEMFNGATAFNQNIGSWDVRNVANFTNFMASKTPSTFSTTNLDAIYSGWSQLTVKPNNNISFGTAKYTDVGGLAGRNILTGAPYNWTIVDGGN